MLAHHTHNETATRGLLDSIREDPLSPQTKERVRIAVKAQWAAADIAKAMYAGLEGVLATYWVALQEGKLRSNDSEFYRIVGMRRYLRACYQDSHRLLDFLEETPEFFEMLGRMTSWQH